MVLCAAQYRRVNLPSGGTQPRQQCRSKASTQVKYPRLTSISREHMFCNPNTQTTISCFASTFFRCKRNSLEWCASSVSLHQTTHLKPSQQLEGDQVGSTLLLTTFSALSLHLSNRLVLMNSQHLSLQRAPVHLCLAVRPLKRMAFGTFRTQGNDAHSDP